MKKHIITLVALASAAACFAQNTITRPADSTSGSARAIVGFTGGISSSDVGRLISEAGGGGGATLLPYDLPGGSWRNAATYPLQVTTTPAGRTTHQIQVNGRVVNQVTSNDGGSNDTITAIIPAGANFYVNRPAVVTAMANSATWQATGIQFSLGESYTASASTITTNVWACYVIPPSYDFSYVYYPNSCPAVGWGWQTLSGFSYGPAGPFTSSAYLYSYGTSYAFYMGAVTNTTCSWTRRTSDNWGRTTVSGSGSVAAWPAGVTCDSTNVAHYFAGTGPFAPPDPCANGACINGYMNKKDEFIKFVVPKLA